MKKNKRKTIFTITILLLVTIIISFLFVPLFKNLKFGLDLQGGFEVLYDVKTIDGSDLTQEMVTNTYKTISKRIDVLGVSEPEIIQEGNKIRVKLAGVTNQDEARKMLSTTASLTFRDTSDNLLMTSDVLKAGNAKLTSDDKGSPAVLLSVKDKEKFYEVTNKVKDYTNNQIVIWLDFDGASDSYESEKANCGSLSSSKCLSAASVTRGFASDVIIQGNFTNEEATTLVDLINSGSLPTKLVEVSSKTVGASFGENTLTNTLIAGVIGISLIIILMICLYRLSGLIASISMIIYAFLVFLAFWSVGGVLTLPGIAAIVLGIGMAVDANVITFERIKEELYNGKSLDQAYSSGNKRSFSSIIDSNITTLIVAIILFILGESSVKGFATMLIITIIVTMLIMVVLTRLLIGSLVKNKYFNDKLKLFINIKSENIPNLSKNESKRKEPFKKMNFLKNRLIHVLIPVIIIIVGIIITSIKGLNLSIDFRGGSDITLNTDKKITENLLKEDVKNLKLDLVDVELIDNGAYIRIDNTLDSKKTKEVSKYFEDKYSSLVEVGVVSNIVKQDLTKNAFLSVVFALIGIVVYVSIRFKFSFAVGAIVALVHDVLIIISLFALFRLEVSVMFIAAILAIIGYSVNNTIVVFDRIREKLPKNNVVKTEEELKNIVNSSLRDTLTRSIFTTITTLLPVVSLIFLGSFEILNFNLALVIGLIAGTYSSLLIAPLIWYLITKKQIGKTKTKKKRWNFEDDLKELNVKGVNS